MNDRTSELQIQADRTQPALIHAAQLPWVASPELGIERRMLERIGGEVALATSIVRYQPATRFPAHIHELGEEFLVLAGTFSDQDGDYPVGTYARNPPGSGHAPFSKDGCVLFVKLRQMQADESEQVRVFPADRQWHVNNTRGYECVTLYDNGRVSVELQRLTANAEIPAHTNPGGEELLVVAGSVILHKQRSSTLATWSWLREPGNEHAGMSSSGGALLWVKRGHLV